MKTTRLTNLVNDLLDLSQAAVRHPDPGERRDFSLTREASGRF